MKRSITQAIIIVIISAAIGGLLNLIRADKIPWISVHVEPPIADLRNPDSTAVQYTYSYPNSISVDDVDSLRSLSAVLIDARLPEFYKAGHIPGAVNIPFEDLNPYLDKLFTIPKDTMVILYCDGDDCELSYDLALYMIQRGFRRVYDFQGGWEQWIASGLPEAKGEQQ